MKKILGSVCGFLLMAGLALAQTSVLFVDENFSTTASATLYKKTNVSQQVTQRMSVTGSGYYWGFFTPGGTAGTDLISEQADALRVVVGGRARVAGAHMYTRFQSGTTAAVANTLYNTPSEQVDASGAEYGAVIATAGSVSPNVTGPDANRVALLIRTATGWFQSSDVEMLTINTNYKFPFAGASAVTWRQIDTAVGTPGADMDEVDFVASVLNGGVLTYTNNLGEANPVLTQILGMGLILTAPTTNDTPTGALHLTRMYIGDVTAPAVPANVQIASSGTENKITVSWDTVSGAVSYDVLRSETAGSGYTSVATGVTALSFEDTTGVNGTTYYYVVRSADDAFSGTTKTNPAANNASANSAEVFATAGTVSSVSDWINY